MTSADIGTRMVGVTSDSLPAFFATALWNFHADYRPSEMWEAHLATLQPERFFGFMAGDTWVATCGAYTHRLGIPGGAIDAAGVTYVTVAPTHRRHGLLRAMMNAQLRGLREQGEAVATLWASHPAIYGRFGYGSAAPMFSVSGRISELGLAGGPEFAGSVDLRRGPVSVDELAAIHAAVSPLRPGMFVRGDAWWRRFLYDGDDARAGASSLRCAVARTSSGAAAGYALYRIRPSADGGDLAILELCAEDPAIRRELWRVLLSSELVARITASVPVDEPLLRWLTNPRALETRLADAIYLRIVDLARAMAERAYAADVDVVLEVADDVIPENAGIWRLEARDGVGTATRAEGPADVRLGIRELGSAYLGGLTIAELRQAGQVEELTPGAATRLSQALAWSPRPFCGELY